MSRRSAPIQSQLQQQTYQIILIKKTLITINIPNEMMRTKKNNQNFYNNKHIYQIISTLERYQGMYPSAVLIRDGPFFRSQSCSQGNVESS
jgi:hypothetical protein